MHSPGSIQRRKWGDSSGFPYKPEEPATPVPAPLVIPPSCAFCNKEGAGFQCAFTKIIYYCDESCQQKHRAENEPLCQAIVRAGADDADATTKVA